MAASGDGPVVSLAVLLMAVAGVVATIGSSDAVESQRGWLSVAIVIGGAGWAVFAAWLVLGRGHRTVFRCIGVIMILVGVAACVSVRNALPVDSGDSADNGGSAGADTSGPDTSSSQGAGDGTTSPQSGASQVYLTDLEPLADHAWYSFAQEPARMGGETYARSVLMDAYREAEAYVEYDLSGDFAYFQAAIGVRDDAPAGTSLLVSVYGDGDELEAPVEVRLGEVAQIETSVEGMLRLRLEVLDLSDEFPQDVYAVFGDAQLRGQ